MRLEGGRFFNPIPVPFDPLPYDGKRLEVALSSMPGPQSFSKLTNDHGVIDLSGLAAIVDLGRNQS